MVSPSKHQRQQQQQQHYRLPSRENNSNSRASHVRTEKRSKPLEKKSFYLDIKNHAIAAKLETKIKELGGTIELFLVRSVNLVITDRADKASRTNSERHKWGSINGGSGGTRSLRSIEVPTPTPTPPTPFLSSECPLSNSTNPRGQTAQRSKSRVDAMLERALIQPQQCSVDPLDNALNWGIPIWTTDKLQIWLDKIYISFKNTNDLKHLKKTNQHSTKKPISIIKCLKVPYIKFEAYRRNTRPVFLELSTWPTLNFDGDPGSCPFGTKKQGKLESKFISREIKENKEDIESINKEESKEMTRRPRATATRARRTEQVVAGYCEICHSKYDDLSKHVQSEQHLNFVRNDDNFLSLDTLINAGANVEAFLKLNRNKDIEQDCNLFPNGDSNLHNAVLPEDKVTKNPETLNNFSVDEIKMVQCNGVRRNLNLKLSSSHNLRTRAKHESGHLLRSKGSPWHELDKNEKCYDKLEGFTIKKRSKGTIWIEEEDPSDKYVDILKESKEEDYKIKSLSKVIDEVYHTKEDNADSKHSNIDSQSLQQAIIHNSAPNGIINSRHISENVDLFKKKSHEEYNGNENADLLECTINENGVVDNSYIENCKSFKEEMFRTSNCTLQSEKVILDTRTFSDDTSKIASEIVCNGHNGRNVQKDIKTQSENTRYMKFRYSRPNRRGCRSVRGRHRLSVEERLIKDNRAYYKVEVLGNKLRSSAMPGCNNIQPPPVPKDIDSEEKKEVPSSEKPVVVRFKRVRKSELSLLSDEAESFMFGELKRDDSSEASEGEQSSVLPQDTESESNEAANSVLLSSSLNSTSPMKQEIIEEDSQDSVHLGRVRKKRRTQAEVFIKDNTDYYKFETPGSRLRYQAPLTGIKDNAEEEHTKRTAELENSKLQTDAVIETTYPSKPSAEIEKMQFSFEAIPKSEPWYQTYQRQDTGAEYWHYFSEGDNMRKPFLLPYEIENFHETMIKNQIRIDGRKRPRGRGIGCMGRSPRKSPRCHASTLAIMSTIIRKKEQHFSNLCTIEESPVVNSRTNTPGPDQQQNLKVYIDEDLKEVTKTIDDMFDVKGMAEIDDLLELDEVQVDLDFGSNIPKGAPSNLLELLNNCQDITTCLENSSCASSECGEANPESTLKRRKRRKNRTGWPGNKMKKKLPNNKTITDVDCDREILTENRLYSDNRFSKHHTLNTSNRSTVAIDSHVTSNNTLTIVERLSVNKKNDVNSLSETYTSNKSSHEGLVKRDKSLECTNETGLSVNSKSYVESSITEVCDDVDRNYLSNKDYPYRKDLSEMEISENEPGNDENHENNLFRKDVNTITERNFIAKPSIKKRQRENTASDTCKSHTEIENHEILCRKDTTESVIVPRKHHTTNGLSTKQQRRVNSDNPDSELVRRHRLTRRGRLTSRKRRRRQVKACQPVNNLSSDTAYENENCKKDSYLSITCKKQQSMRNIKRKSEAISTDLQESDLERALTERVSPTVVISSAELEQRRSSIDFQPVVRMMKIDDQVDIDHSIIAVTVASNRRLRSSSSPRSNIKPPKKRLKSSRGQFRRWLKSS